MGTSFVFRSIVRMLDLFLNPFAAEEWLFTDSGKKNAQQQNNSQQQGGNLHGAPQQQGEFPLSFDPINQLQPPPRQPQQNPPPQNQFSEDVLYFEELFSIDTPTSSLNQPPCHNNPRPTMQRPQQTFMTSQKPLQQMWKSPQLELCPDPDEFLTADSPYNGNPRNINHRMMAPYPQISTPQTPYLFAQDDSDFFGPTNSSLSNDDQSLGNQVVGVSTSAPQLVALDHNYSQTTRQQQLSPCKIMTSQCTVTSSAPQQQQQASRKRSRPSADLRTDVSQLIRITSSPSPPQQSPLVFSEFPESRTSSYDSFQDNSPLSCGNSPSTSYLQHALQQPSSSFEESPEAGPSTTKKRRRNNEACRESRKKKKNERVENEIKVQTLSEENDELKVAIERLERERDAVKKELMDTIKRGFCS